MKTLFSTDLSEGQAVILHYKGNQYPCVVSMIYHHSASFCLNSIDESNFDTPIRFGVVLEDNLLRHHLQYYPESSRVTLA